MNNELNIEELYESYEDYCKEFQIAWINQFGNWLGDHNRKGIPLSEEEFTNKIKTDSEFAKRWEIKK